MALKVDVGKAQFYLQTSLIRNNRTSQVFRILLPRPGDLISLLFICISLYYQLRLFVEYFMNESSHFIFNL